MIKLTALMSVTMHAAVIVGGTVYHGFSGNLVFNNQTINVKVSGNDSYEEDNRDNDDAMYNRITERNVSTEDFTRDWSGINCYEDAYNDPVIYSDTEYWDKAAYVGSTENHAENFNNFVESFVVEDDSTPWSRYNVRCRVNQGDCGAAET